MRAFVLVIAFGLDLLIGDPRFLPHPVVLFGKIITRTLNWTKSRSLNAKQQRSAGLVLAFLLPLISAFVVSLILHFAASVHEYLAYVVEIVVLYQLLASKELYKQSMEVYKELLSGDLDAARLKLAYIVGRDTKSLSEKEIIKASVETVAENTNDALVAPLFYAAMGGAPLAIAYKAINTLDSMIGYRSARFINFGKASAILDDIASWIPARITAALLLASSFLLNINPKEAFQIYKRDRHNHLSPNAGHPESVVAGALQIQLGGNHEYEGVLVLKPSIGDQIVDTNLKQIKYANSLMLLSSILALALFGSIALFIEVLYA